MYTRTTSPRYRDVEVPINFTYESRALLTGIEENLVYINFKFNNVPSDMTLHVGKSMPWGVSKGNAIQYMSNKQLQSLREGIHYEVIEKMIYRGAKWRRVPYGVQNYGKQLDNILDKVKCK